MAPRYHMVLLIVALEIALLSSVILVVEYGGTTHFSAYGFIGGALSDLVTVSLSSCSSENV
jgi:formate hydrogenlyase subunit 3/multisubunit Na+/H+ antiporter MnhD subunit